MGYKNSAIKGFSLLTSAKVATKALALIKMMVIARILTPHDLGAVGLATVILTLSEVCTETGTNAYLIQTEDDPATLIDTIWIVSMGRGIFIGVILALLALILRPLYNEPLLTPLLLVAALIPIVKGFTNPAIVLLQRNLEYTKEVTLRTILVAIEVCLSILLTLWLRSPAALILALLLTAFIEVGITHLLLNIKPRIAFSKANFRKITKFGKWLNLQAVVGYVAITADDLIIGKLLGTTTLGFYQSAFNISQATVGEIGELGSQTVFPIFSKIAGDAKRAKRALFMSIIGLSLFLLLPLMITLLFARPLVLLILGTQWLPSIPIVQLLAVSAYIQAISALIFPFFLAKGKPSYNVYTLGIFILIMTGCITVFTPMYGILGACAGLIIARLLTAPIMVFGLKKVWNHSD